jgi:hypothetical protein
MHEDSFILNPLGIPPIQIGREPLLAAAKNVHARIDAGGLGGKIVLLPWLAV